ncbi:MAG TPA: hypothetical protein VJ890_07580, partial [Vineibacter sp.]|nr:hypothetical protein [Vineibacter sp.]
MGKTNAAIAAFNRGIVSPLALGRVDLERLRLAAETCVNWLPQVLGPMSLRPGLGYVGATKNNAAARCAPFVAATADAQMLVFSDDVMRVLKNDAYVMRPSVSTAVTNGDMGSGTGWSTTLTGGATANFNINGNLEMNCVNRGGKAVVGQTVTVSGANQNVAHGLRVVVSRGPVTFRVGTAGGDDSYVRTTTLRTGTHSLAFTPSGNFHLEIEINDDTYRYVDSVTVEAAGTLE